METLLPPKPRAQFYAVACKNSDCNAIIRCREDELETVKNPPNMKGCDQWFMVCPHCQTRSQADVRKAWT